MRGIDHSRAFRHFVQFVNENSALLGKIVYNVTIMNDFLTYVDGRAESVQRDLHDIDGADYTRAKATRFQQKDALCRRFWETSVDISRVNG